MKRSRFWPVVAAATVFFVIALSAVAVADTTPTITSDKADYAPGETVTLTGSGWQAGESVHIRVNDDAGETWRYDNDVVADDAGGLTDSFQLPEWFVAVYTVTATGAVSGTVTTTFTDANLTILGTDGNQHQLGGPGNPLVNEQALGNVVKGDPLSVSCSPGPGLTVRVTGLSGGPTPQTLTWGLAYDGSASDNTTLSPLTTLNPTSDSVSGTGQHDTCVSMTITTGTLTLNTTYHGRLRVTKTGGTGTASDATYLFRFTVTAPANTPPSVSVTGVTNGSSYAKGSVPAAGCSATDAEDGPSTFAATLSAITGPDAAHGIGSQTASCSYTDSGGSSASASATYTITDPSAPSITYVLSPLSPDGDNDWYKSNVTLTWTVAENDSPSTLVKTGCVDQNISADQAETTYSCSAASAGGSAGPVDVKIKRDATAPTISAALDRSPAGTSWFNIGTGAPIVQFTCSDNLSGLAGSCPADHPFGDGENQSYSQTIKDNAGNSATDGVSNVDVDLTAPSISAALDRSPDAGTGWFNIATGAPVVRFTCSDATSGIATCPGDYTFGEGEDQEHDGMAFDNAGNSTSDGVSNVDVDLTAPLVTVTPGRGPDFGGWYNAPVVFDTSGTDATSGVLDANCTAGQNYTGPDGEDLTVSGSCTDNAGNSAGGTSDAFDFDDTNPTLTLVFTPDIPDGNNGWWKTPGGVPFAWTCTDLTSGIDDTFGGGCPSPLSGTETAQGTTNFADQVRDQAGNLSDDVDRDLKLDNVAPSVTVTPDGPPDHNGWYNAPVVFDTNGTDATSLIASCTAGQNYTGPDGEDLTVSGSCTDNAGNSAGGTSDAFDFDDTNPTISILVPPVGPATYLLNQAIASDYSCSDAMSDIDSCAGPVADGGDINTGSVGAKNFTVNAADNAGNTASSTHAYAVQYAPLGTMCNGSPGHAILQPINANGDSVFKQGSTVPAKFRVCDANGNSIGAPGVVSSFKLVAKSVGTIGLVDEDPVSTTPDTAFRWSSTDQQWIFNMSTKSLTKNVTYFYEITLNDGTTIPFSFGLK